MKSDDRLFGQALIACLSIMGVSVVGMLILGNCPMNASVPAESPTTVLTQQSTDSVQAENQVQEPVVITVPDPTTPHIDYCPVINVVEPQPVIIHVTAPTPPPPPEITVPAPQEWQLTTQPQLLTQFRADMGQPRYAIYYTELPQYQNSTLTGTGPRQAILYSGQFQHRTIDSQYEIYYNALPQFQSQTTNILTIPQQVTQFSDLSLQYQSQNRSFSFQLSDDDIKSVPPSPESTDDGSQPTPEPTTEP